MSVIKSKHRFKTFEYPIENWGKKTIKSTEVSHANQGLLHVASLNSHFQQTKQRESKIYKKESRETETQQDIAV